MSIEEALSVLELPRTASQGEARQAYLRLLKLHKPDVDPPGFRRLRDAYELLMQVLPSVSSPEPPPEAPPEANAEDASSDPNDGDDEPPAPRPYASVFHDDADAALVSAVETALDELDFDRAATLVLDDAWASALQDSPRARTATVRLASAAVLGDAKLYTALEWRYRDVITSAWGHFGDREGLTRLQLVAREWQVITGTIVEIPDPLRRFVAYTTSASASGRLTLAEGLIRWFWSDPVGAYRILRRIAELGNTVPSFIAVLVEEAEAELDDASVPRGAVPVHTRQPNGVLKPLFIAADVFAVVVATLTVLRGGRRHGLLARLVGVMLAYGVFVLEASVFKMATRLQIRYALACAAADLRPREHAMTILGHPRTAEVILDSEALDLAWLLARLGRRRIDTRPDA